MAATASPRRLRVEPVVPSASRTIESLRDVGYELTQAVADLVDNSIAAAATTVAVDLRFDSEGSWIRIADNGTGMDAGTLTESLRYGSERAYSEDDLGKFGFGLKSASTSQCRRVTVASRRGLQRARIEARCLDLDHIARTNRWEAIVVEPSDRPAHLTEPLKAAPGTVVLWENLDRVLDYKDPYGTWAHRRMLSAAQEVEEHLGMVFHRFLAGEAPGRRLKLRVNGQDVAPWDPFCRDEKATDAHPETNITLATVGGTGIVRIRPYVLPERQEFSSTNAWQRASGPLKWNRQQGFYVYRANRLVQWGGWSRIRTVDEHTKLARVALDFAPNLDHAFGINISKASVRLPGELRDALEPIISRVAAAANRRYRTTRQRTGATPPRPSPTASAGPSSDSTPRAPETHSDSGTPPRSSAGATPTKPPGGDGFDSPQPKGPAALADLRPALEAAAAHAGRADALTDIVRALREKNPEIAHELGW
ncbi:ATP-binding protein [Blastococcus sp. CT_GayMR16]|uniref:ATP-binding protein n=1 Tax=Blastococcus sp. CT_GayMR16 TaxID=2559607 RepID=UPI0010744C3F|nr:ATP-binding protein [Blastococcus sp. CT_GayMR16]TFV87404.1 ATP-binding protein [Blastococcus sp. CT_GayMR16]